MQRMLVGVLRDFDKLELEEVPRPEPKDVGTVSVQIRSCGICATDYKAIKGIRRNVRFPFIPGHEPSGVVADVGRVTHFKAGDEVICQPSGCAASANTAGREHPLLRTFVHLGGDGQAFGGRIR